MTDEQLYELRDICDEPLIKVFNDIFKLEESGFSEEDIYYKLKEHYVNIYNKKGTTDD